MESFCFLVLKWKVFPVSRSPYCPDTTYRAVHFYVFVSLFGLILYWFPLFVCLLVEFPYSCWRCEVVIVSTGYYIWFLSYYNIKRLWSRCNGSRTCHHNRRMIRHWIPIWIFSLRVMAQAHCELLQLFVLLLTVLWELFLSYEGENWLLEGYCICFGRSPSTLKQAL